MSSKLIIHETDCHGSGFAAYEGKVISYIYDDEGDIRRVVERLIELGFIPEDKVMIYDGDELYKILSLE